MIRISGAQPSDHLALLRVPRHNDRNPFTDSGHGLKRVKTEVALPRSFIRAVTDKTTVGQKRTDLSVEVNGLNLPLRNGRSDAEQRHENTSIEKKIGAHDEPQSISFFLMVFYDIRVTES